MNFWRTALGILMILSTLSLIFSWGPWYLMMFLPLALLLVSLRNDVLVAKRERAEFRKQDATTIGHAYRE
ncbi:hypothetical protein [Arthrobacter sp. RIT-PI-e]|uniref:hypothetical protein n=1 Tax=Arthrobacter sp. RIT-PI-e TaxID=1681197 RepID=UPI000A90305A|nr:hypothetical protein [Arthrobacter sp. RIT-PI-e]